MTRPPICAPKSRRSSRSAQVHCVLVDEAQFLTHAQVLELACVCDDLDIPVLAYGLRTDFQGNLFAGSGALLALADNLVELKAICECGRKATMNLRVDADGRAVKAGAQTEIGGNDRYIALVPPPFHGAHSPRWRASNCACAWRGADMHGWLVIDKPVGIGSTQVVGAVKRALREGGYAKVKVGHGGTLDPLASGVLPVALGEATKLAGRMLDSDKVYEFTIGFGAETDTLDLEGEDIATRTCGRRRRRLRRSCPASPARSSRCRRLIRR